uniref:NADH-plastoquinone oxidoreductase subunit J n=1 Tax=Odontochilus yakushimensis TaxID=2497344 RepID=UPI0020370512|nr:NADH-plastoquinone oxidoreductase subunit J [Odontochilus yakushimensis]UQW83351.1 NADH-plastoquinone oxidoreductase subunit J [Odontochilus yakushimensis]
MPVHLSDWLVKHELVHRSLGFDCRGIETLQIKTEDCCGTPLLSFHMYMVTIIYAPSVPMM